MKSEELHEILMAILESDYVKRQRKERDIKEEIEFYGYLKRQTDFELEIVEYFFEGFEEVLKVKPIWLWLKNEILAHIKYGLGLGEDTPEKFLKDGLDFNMEEYVNRQLKDLEAYITDYYRQILDAEWQSLTLKQAQKRLPKNQQYVALLDEKGKLTREPFPITRDLTANLTWQICIDEYDRPWLGKVKQKNIHVQSDKPLFPETTCKGRVIHLQNNEANATIIKT